MSKGRTGRYLAIALNSCALLASCGEAGGDISVVGFEEYGDIPRCWFREGEELKAFMVVAEGDGMSVPWLVSSRCIATEDQMSFGAGTLAALGPPYFADPAGLLRRVASNMVEDNEVTHLPFPGSNSRVYYIVAQMQPRGGGSRSYKMTGIEKAVPTGVTFGGFLEMGLEQRAELLKRVR